GPSPGLAHHLAQTRAVRAPRHRLRVARRVLPQRRRVRPRAPGPRGGRARGPRPLVPHAPRPPPPRARRPRLLPGAVAPGAPARAVEPVPGDALVAGGTAREELYRGPRLARRRFRLRRPHLRLAA